jgi:hypothetical protein
VPPVPLVLLTPVANLPPGNWFMKRTWSKKSRDTVPLRASGKIRQS